MQAAMRRWFLLLPAAGLPLLGVGCGASVRDAIAAGAFDFVTTTVTDALLGLFPVAELLTSG